MAPWAFALALLAVLYAHRDSYSGLWDSDRPAPVRAAPGPAHAAGLDVSEDAGVRGNRGRGADPSPRSQGRAEGARSSAPAGAPDDRGVPTAEAVLASGMEAFGAGEFAVARAALAEARERGASHPDLLFLLGEATYLADPERAAGEALDWLRQAGPGRASEIAQLIRLADRGSWAYVARIVGRIRHEGMAHDPVVRALRDAFVEKRSGQSTAGKSAVWAYEIPGEQTERD